jgi:two-component system sensor histidine kinase PilS (NtrC family)
MLASRIVAVRMPGSRHKFSMSHAEPAPSVAQLSSPAHAALAPLNGSTFWRSLQTLNISRVLVALVLLAYINFKSSKDFGADGYVLFHNTALVYVLIASAFVLLKLYYPKRFLTQLGVQITCDLLVISILYLAGGGNKSGLAVLYLFPLAGVGILSSLLWGLFFAAVATLFLLGDSAYRAFLSDDTVSFPQAGLYGTVFFAVVYLLNRLAKNLIRQEELALLRGQALAIQQAINRLIFADMGDGILVVDQEDRIFQFNPAAERMLGFADYEGHFFASNIHASLGDIPLLRPIADALAARRDATVSSSVAWLREENASFIALRQDLSSQKGDEYFNATEQEPSEFTIHLKLRFASIDQRDLSELTALSEHDSSYTIIFMQNVSDIENQAQQLKLASMGRLTASIAHEVRNPLSSISYAASLLAEDIRQEPQAARLLKIVDDNVARLNQLIEDILKLSRKAQLHTKPFLLMPEVAAIVRDFVEIRNLPTQQIYLDQSVDFMVVFDPAHLREVIVNLLSNATRYASSEAGSIRIYGKLGGGVHQELHIQDDGPGISKAVRAHLFEPFYTTSNKGTGLGLYMARELCLNNHALLDYDYRNDEPLTAGIELKGRFVINFSAPEPT